jgi:hypothetical protein
MVYCTDFSQKASDMKLINVLTNIFFPFFSSIDQLLQRNADYLVNAISLRLRHFNENKQSPLVLKVILQYSSVEILPLIDDTIQEVKRKISLFLPLFL